MLFNSLLHSQYCWISYCVPCTKRGHWGFSERGCLKQWLTISWLECREEKEEAWNNFPTFCYCILFPGSPCPEQLRKKSLPKNRRPHKCKHDRLNQVSYLTKVLDIEIISPAQCSGLREVFFSFLSCSLQPFILSRADARVKLKSQLHVPHQLEQKKQ